MVASTKFASLVGTVTLAFVLASSLHPVRTAPVGSIRRQDATSDAAAAPAPAGFISVAQPQMTEQDIYALGIPDAPASSANTSTADSQLQQVLQAASQAALSTSDKTSSIINHWDPTPPVAGATAATPATAPVAASNAQIPASNVTMTGNPNDGSLYQQVVGTPAGAPGSTDAALSGNADDGDAYRQIVAEQMQQFGAQGLQASKRQEQQSGLGLGVPTPSSATMVPNAAVPEASGAATAADASASTATSAAPASASDLAGVPVAAPVPSDFSTPPTASPAGDAAVPSALSPSVPAVPDPVSSAVPSTPALPTGEVPPAPALPTGAVPPVSAAPSVSAPVSDAPALPTGAVTAVPSLAGGLKDASDASATTLLPTSDANPTATAAPSAAVASAAATGDLTMTVTLPSQAQPTSLSSLANVLANNRKEETDDDADWKTMTILVPADAFGGNTKVNAPISTASASSTVSVSANENAVSSSSATPTAAPINLSSFSSMKAQATPAVLTIPLTGVIDGTTYSTMLTLTVPGGAKTSSLAVTDKVATATASATASSAKPSSTTSVDPSYISPEDTPPLLRSSSTASTPAATATASPSNSNNDDECDDTDDADSAQVTPTAGGKSLMTKVWDWVTGKPLNERDFLDDYGIDYDDDEEEFYDAQQ
ncbi:hypothetical protein PHSY_002708 [Pseudozyma hubeiensis SY62]|uniref:Uncharacterized protein n=1 Tax=Pseudozyma hubeiensis (strain SY62) TaxID=1305764 RepID=R9P1G4_PSEHS|nr:hypothetical protein PHSY_002708 [Pseudozyma hubeiensis SY62]GAC95133.1 hypothetical protein PHSY_002708 [Pseudozyma hubeiensis SY62]